MIKFLLPRQTCHTRAKKEPNPFLFHQRKQNVFLFALVLSILLASTSTFSQDNDVDTWFRADRGVNADPAGINIYLLDPGVPGTYGNPGGDGTPVTQWYDVSFAPQDLVPQPLIGDYPLAPPAGFDYPFGSSNPSFLTPFGSEPGLPTFRRNPTDNINFNPVVHFDGSGDGQALHFRSVTREDATIFIVFKAIGGGDTAETQKLLFGGDVETHHTSFDPYDWGVNLSLGVANGNRFSVGRTWFGDNTDGDIHGDGDGRFYQGGIDLLGAPTIGTFTRETALDQETLITYVNGIEDINEVRSDPLSDGSLYFFNRVGKHFNSNDENRNLTGDIAEIILADVALQANFIQRVESYLAIKYGITLFNGNQLGSIAGNDSYNYLAADGSTIWQAEATYKHDIAGLGADRYNDNGPDPDLRYSLYQRIAKSVNSDAIVTMSTDNDFSTDNLNESRASIDRSTGGSHGGGSQYVHNYLLWANDNATINVDNTELPAGINTRIGREWRVQMNNSNNVDPITDVSVRIDLSGSNIAKVACALKLLIDTDEDGDFSTGDITMIDATSVDGFGNVYFDDVTFLHNEVFTIGFGDTTPDITSNPGNQNVCDEYLLPNIIGTNLTGGQAYYDAPNGGGNRYAPGDVITASGTYYIYDTTGAPLNCFDEESFNITVNTTPSAPNANDRDFCSADNPTGADLIPAPSATITWYSDAGLNNIVADADALVSGDYFVTETVNNCQSAAAQIAVTVNTTPSAPNANDRDFCSADNPTGADLIPAPSATITWYSDAGLNNIVADADALVSGDYFVTETVNNCQSAAAQIAVTVNTTPSAPNANDRDFCSADNPTGADLIPAPSATITWYSDAGLNNIVADADALVSGDYFVTETVNNCQSAAAQIAVTVNTTPSAPNANDRDFCSADNPTGADLIPAPSATITWYSDAGLNNIVADADALVSGDYFVTETVNNCQSAAAQIAVTVNTTPSAPNANDRDFCSADNPTGADLIPAPSATITWYSDAGLNNIVADADALVSGDYFVTETVNNCQSAAAQIAVTVNTTPSAPNANDRDFCSADNPTGADLIPAPSATITWYSDAGLNNIVADADALVSGDYFVTETVNNCQSAAAQIAVTVNTTPSAPNANDRDFCSADNPTGADLIPAPSATITWYSDAGLNNIVADADALVSGDYFVTETVNNCQSAAAQIAVTVNTTPSAPNANDRDFCSADNPTGADLIPAPSATITWYSDAGLNNIVADADALVSGDYFVTETVNNCQSAAAQIAVTVNTTPSAPNANDRDFCSADNPTGADLIPAPSATITWYSDAGLNNIVADADALVSGDYFVTETVNNCQSAAAQIAVTVNTTPSAPNANDRDFCSADNPTGADLIPAPSATITWYSDAGLNNIVADADALVSGDYFVTETVNNCQSAAAQIAVTVNTTPSAPNANDRDFCSADNPTGADLIPAPSATITWYSDAGLNNIVADADALVSGDYFVTETVNNCQSAAAQIAVTVNTTPSAPNANDRDFCSADNPTGADLIPAPSATITWYSDAGLNNIVADADALVSGDYFVTETVNNCQSAAAQIAVTVNTTPSAPNANDRDFCSADNPTGADLIPAPSATITWYSDAGLNNIVADADALVSGDYFVTETVNNCQSAAAQIAVTVNTTPSAPNANDRDFCSADNPTGADLIPAPSATITWYSDAGLNNIVADADALVSGDYFVTETVNNCQSAAAQIAVTVNTTPSAPNANDRDFCSADNPTGADLIPAPSATITWYSDAGLNNIVADADALVSGDYFVTETVNNCQSAAAQIAVTVTPEPTVNAGSDEDVCSTASFDLGLSSTVPTANNFSTISWSTSGDGFFNNIFQFDPTYTPGPNDISNGSITLTLTANGNGSCNVIQDSMILTLQPQPDAGTNANLTICQGGTVTEAQLFAQLGGTPDVAGSWSPVLEGAGVYTYTVAATAPCTTEATATVTVTEQAPPDPDSPENIEACGFYILPALTNGNYFDMPNGGGNALSAGDNITTTTTLYVFSPGNGSCPDAQNSFVVTINNTPLADAPADVEDCDAYTLPALTNGNYFDMPNGGGNALSAGDNITTTTTLYVFSPGNGSCPDAQNSFVVTINNTPLADAPADVEDCDAYTLPALTNGNYFDMPNGGGNALSAGDNITTTTTLYVFSPGNGSCPDAQNSFVVTINNTPLADAPADVEDCDAYTLPALTNGNYFDMPNGGGNTLSAGDNITTTTTLYVFSPGNGSCPDAQNSFVVTINSLLANTSIQNESCLGTNDGAINISIDNGLAPYTVQVDSNPAINFANDNFTIDGLSTGSYSLRITDANGCEMTETVQIQTEGVNLNAMVQPIYGCDTNISTNTLEVLLEDSSVASDVLYALDSTSPNDFVLSSSFRDIPPGTHFLSILHNNGCMETIPFEIEFIAPLQLNLANTNINEITATTTGGVGSYTYFFENRPGTNNNVFHIAQSGRHTIRVVDNNGCETFETMVLEFLDIEIPDFFTPNNDGQNDLWSPRNIEGFPKIETIIFDRYGREIRIMGALDAGWDGHYEGSPLPSGDYWYIVRLNDESEREFVGHFTLYR
ncbi:T9SS type B sorting domain-containing protein [Flagellimonas sp.]|uniref:T9SS type B sorting domain-containing protein n=1 Tax=Flagellimonas sp. TaxID=2058762 RepID=UPI003B501D16